MDGGRGGSLVSGIGGRGEGGNYKQVMRLN